MFGKKQEYTKELEQKLNTTQSQMETLQAKIDQVGNNTQQILPYFESQIIAQSEMDQELTKIVSHAYDTIAAGSESSQLFEQFAIELTGMRGQLEEDEQGRIELQAAVHTQKEQADAVMDGSKQFTAVLQQVQETRAALLADAGEMHGQLRQMQEFSKQMSVLSLNCAIEAGRMGESGRQFIGAAEDVRQLANAYESAAQTVGQRLAGMETQIRRLEEQAGGMAKILKDSETSLSRLSKSISENEEQCIGAAKKELSKKVGALSDNLKKISQNNDTIHSLQDQTLSEIERIGQSFMDEQEARKELERIFEQIEAVIRS